MWDFSGLFDSYSMSGMGDKLANYATDELNKSTGGLMDYFAGKVAPTAQGASFTENVLNGAKTPGLGQAAADLGAGNWGSALGSISAMSPAASQGAQQLQAAQLNNQTAIMSNQQKQMADDQAAWKAQGQKLQQNQQNTQRNLMQLAAMVAL